MHVPHHTHTAPILGAYFKPDAAAYYRLAVPLGVAGGAVAPYAEMRGSQVDGAECVAVTRLGALPGSDLVALRNIVRRLKSDAGRVVADIDDDLWGLGAARLSQQTNLPALEAVLREADTITTTNPTLAGRVRRFGRDVRVLPNYVNGEDWPAPAPRPDGPPVVVLAGGNSHAADWRVVAPALRRLVDEGVALRVCGFLPDYLRPLCADFRPWAGLDAYPAMLAGATVGLCPLPDSGFNRCKSPIKLFEYALSGAAVVASPCQYGPVLRAAGQGAYVVPDGGDWYTPIRAALADTQAAPALRAHVIAHHDARHHAATITAAYAA